MLFFPSHCANIFPDCSFIFPSRRLPRNFIIAIEHAEKFSCYWLVDAFDPAFYFMMPTFSASFSTTSFFFLELNVKQFDALETAIPYDCFDLNTGYLSLSSASVSDSVFLDLKLATLCLFSAWHCLMALALKPDCFSLPLSIFFPCYLSPDKINRPLCFLFLLCIPFFWSLLTLVFPC